MQKWNSLANHAGADVKEARLQLHHAVQPLAAAGAVLVPARADYTHTSLTYDPDAGAFIGARLGSTDVEGKSGKDIYGALYIDTLTLALVAGGEAIQRQSLTGLTLTEAFDWFAGVLKTAGLSPGSESLALTLPEYPDYPEHTLVTAKAVFDANLESVKEVRRYFRNSSTIIDGIVANNAGASPVTIWPHHFDMATLITLKEPSQPGGEDGQSVGAGLSPGDGGNDQPYWYVTPWPYPDKEQLPKLGAGKWNTDGWVGAQLDAVEVLAADSDQQDKVVESFFHDAVQASVDLIRSK